MKKFCTVLAIICMIATMEIPVKAEELYLELRVFLNSQGGIDVNLQTNGTLDYPNETSVCIYRHDDILIASEREPFPILSWAAYTNTVTYPFSPNVNYGKNRESEFVHGKGSKLRPGKYFAVVIRWTPDLPNVELSERVDFEIPESTPAPTQLPATPTIEATVSPTMTINQPSAASQPPAVGNNRNQGNPIFWVCTGAVSGAIITLAVAGIVIEARKKKTGKTE